MNHRFDLRVSRFFLLIYLLLYLLACMSVIMLPWHFLIVTAVCTFLFLVCLYHLYRDVLLLGASSIVALRIEGGKPVVLYRDGREIPCEILGDTLVTALLTIVSIRTDKGHRRSIVIFPEGMETERFRMLRVMLKWKREREDEI